MEADKHAGHSESRAVGHNRERTVRLNSRAWSHLSITAGRLQPPATTRGAGPGAGRRRRRGSAQQARHRPRWRADRTEGLGRGAGRAARVTTKATRTDADRRAHSFCRCLVDSGLWCAGVELSPAPASGPAQGGSGQRTGLCSRSCWRRAGPGRQAVSRAVVDRQPRQPVQHRQVRLQHRLQPRLRSKARSAVPLPPRAAARLLGARARTCRTPSTGGVRILRKRAGTGDETGGKASKVRAHHPPHACAHHPSRATRPAAAPRLGQALNDGARLASWTCSQASRLTSLRVGATARRPRARGAHRARDAARNASRWGAAKCGQRRGGGIRAGD